MSVNSVLPTASETEIHALIASRAHWYHRIELAPGIVTPGVNDSQGNLALLDSMGLPRDCSNLRVLDIGTADGFMAFEIERRDAAEVVAIDYRKPTSSGFSIASSILGSRVRHEVENVYDLTPEKYGQFDIILFLGVLYHLRNPLAAFDRVRSVAKPGALLFVETHLLDNAVLLPDGSIKPLESISPELGGLSLWQFHPKDTLNGDHTNKWVPNMTGLKNVVEDAGFQVLEHRIHGGRGLVKAGAIEDKKLAYFQKIDSGKAL